MPPETTLDELCALQDERSLRNVHLVYLGEHGFRVAHTDAERDSEMPLDYCELHCWLQDLDGPPVSPGLYMAVRQRLETYSGESSTEPYAFEPLTVE